MINHISKLLQIQPSSVEGCVKLLEEAAGIPFIARYRKEQTEGLNEVEIAKIRDARNAFIELEKRKLYIIERINNKELLTPLLKETILACTNINELEDIYLPFKPKRKTKADIAKEKGLEPLAKIIIRQNISDFYAKATKFTNKEVKTVDEAIDGALDIISEWINERQNIRRNLRLLWKKTAIIESKKKAKSEDENNHYEMYYDWSEPISKIPSHRVLALFRGENEGILKLKISCDETIAISQMENYLIKSDSVCEKEMKKAIKNAYKRLLSISLETEFSTLLKEQADEKAIAVFVQNLRQLLMTSPMGQKVTLALDPGFKSGCKLVVIDAQGKLLHNETIYPHPPQKQLTLSQKKIKTLVTMFKVEAIAIGNGTAGRETETMIKNISFDRPVVSMMVNENGASVYSASEIARAEFPDYDITVRGAVSIGRRLIDPLAELVKIDPKSIGVGQYQHDVDQKKLQSKLSEVVSSTVNSVGVELNTSSKELLQYVVGVGPSLAQKIINYRDTKGAFKNRRELLKVSGFGEKAFEQAAGFIRIRESENILDNTAVHPESYNVVDKIAKSLNISIEELILNSNLLKDINPENFTTSKVGLYTVKDIITELQKPNRDPRKKIEFFEFDKTVTKISDLKNDMILSGVITNITAFGAFVDVGVHQDGLIHISELADRFVSDPHEIISLNQKVKVRVLSIDLEKKRLQFSLKNV